MVYFIKVTDNQGIRTAINVPNITTIQDAGHELYIHTTDGTMTVVPNIKLDSFLTQLQEQQR